MRLNELMEKDVAVEKFNPTKFVRFLLFLGVIIPIVLIIIRALSYGFEPAPWYLPDYLFCVVTIIIFRVLDMLYEGHFSWSLVKDSTRWCLERLDIIIDGKRVVGKELEILWGDADSKDRSVKILGKTPSGNYVLIKGSVDDEGQVLFYVSDGIKLLSTEEAKNWLSQELKFRPTEYEAIFGPLTAI